MYWLRVSAFLTVYGFLVSGDMLRMGRCKNIPAVQNFSWERAKGEWFLQQELQNGHAYGCVSETYGVNNDGTVDVNKKRLTILSGLFEDVFIGVNVPNRTNPGQFTFNPKDIQFVEFPMVLAYFEDDSYLLTYSCLEMRSMGAVLEGAYIFTKKRNDFSYPVMVSLAAILNDLGIDTTRLTPIIQSDDTCDEHDTGKAKDQANDDFEE